MMGIEISWKSSITKENENMLPTTLFDSEFEMLNFLLIYIFLRLIKL